MSWQMIMFGSVLLTSTATLVQKVLLKDDKSYPIAFSILFQLSIALLIGLFGFLFEDMKFPNLYPLLPNLCLLTIAYGLGSMFMFKALKETDASKFSIIFSSRVILAVVLSSILLHQGLGYKQLIGAIFILISVVLVVARKEKFRLDKGDLYAYISAILFGLEVVNDKFLLQFLPTYPFITIAFLLPALLMLAIRPAEISHFKYFLGKATFIKTLIFCIIYALGAVAYFTSLKLTTNISQAVMINMTTVVVTVILAIILLKETSFLKRKLLGALLSFIGLVLVS